MKYCGHWFSVSHFCLFVYFHTIMGVSMLQIRVSNGKVCASVLWHKFCSFLLLTTTIQRDLKQILYKWSIFVFTFPSTTAYLVRHATLFHFSSSKHDSNRLLNSPVSHETSMQAILRSVYEWKSCFTNTSL